MTSIQLVIERDPAEPECALPFVTATVGGRDYEFVLDTGARNSVIVADEWTSALPLVGTDRSAGVFESRITDVVLVPQFEVGPLVAHDVPMSLTDPDDPDAGSLLGMDVLGQYVIRLDLAHGVLDVMESASSDHELGRDPGGHAFVPIAWPDASARGCVDTGAAMTVVNRAFFDAHPRLFSAARTSMGRGNGGPEVQTPTYRIDGYAIGDVGFGPHVVAVVELPPEAAGTDLILGYPSLVQAIWTFDFPANCWAVHGPAGT